MATESTPLGAHVFREALCVGRVTIFNVTSFSPKTVYIYAVAWNKLMTAVIENGSPIFTITRYRADPVLSQTPYTRACTQELVDSHLSFNGLIAANLQVHVGFQEIFHFVKHPNYLLRQRHVYCSHENEPVRLENFFKGK